MDPSDTAQPIIAKSAGVKNKKKRNNRTFDALPYKPQFRLPRHNLFYIFQIYVACKATKQINQINQKFKKTISTRKHGANFMHNYTLFICLFQDDPQLFSYVVFLNFAISTVTFQEQLYWLSIRQHPPNKFNLFSCLLNLANKQKPFLPNSRNNKSGQLVNFAIQPSWSSQGRKDQSFIENHTTST